MLNFGDCNTLLRARRFPGTIYLPIACSRWMHEPGKYLWHFQMIHHDIWDYDPTAAPQLTTVKHNGQTMDIVAMAD